MWWKWGSSCLGHHFLRDLRSNLRLSCHLTDGHIFYPVYHIYHMRFLQSSAPSELEPSLDRWLTLASHFFYHSTSSHIHQDQLSVAVYDLYVPCIFSLSSLLVSLFLGARCKDLFIADSHELLEASFLQSTEEILGPSQRNQESLSWDQGGVASDSPKIWIRRSMMSL